MKKSPFFIALLMLISWALSGQVGINTDNSLPDNSAMLDVKSVSKGFLPPRMTQAEMSTISNPAEGLIVFCTDCGMNGTGVVVVFMNGAWSTLAVGCILPPSPATGIHVPSPVQIIWSWNTVAGATGYKWSTANNYAGATDMGLITTKTETDLICNTAYTRYVWAYKDCGNSAPVTLNQTTSACGGGGLPCPGTPTVTYGGQVYNTVQIGTQCWFKENLNIGTRINGSGDQTNNSTIEKYCYDDLESNCNVYGGLYQWDEAMQYSTTQGVQGICPAGWHLPTDAEWTTLTDYVNSQPTYQCNSTSGWIAKAMTATTLWNSSTTTCAIGNNISLNNATGFSGLPSGGHLSSGYFDYIGDYFGCWTSTEYDLDNAWYRFLYFSHPEVVRNFAGPKANSISVRCIRD